MIPQIKIIQGDCLTELAKLPDGSVHCCVTSPPYDKLRSYGGFSWDFEGTAKELFRVLAPGGMLCWNVGDQVVDGGETLTSMRQAVYFVDCASFTMHDTMIYNRLNFSAPEKVRYHQAFEFVFCLSKGTPRTFNPIKDRRNVYGGLPGSFGANTKREVDGTLTPKKKYVTAEYGMRTNVWTGPTRGQEEPCQSQPHPAMMPRWLARDLILSWSNTGDTILDPFGGSGTTGEVALELGRSAILIELNPQYINLAQKRTHVTPGLPLA